MNEAAKFEIQKKKLQGLCDEHEYVYKLNFNSYPISITIQPADTGSQMSFDGDGEDSKVNPDSAIEFSFEDGDLTVHIAESFTISDATFSKLKNIAKKLYAFWTGFFFRDVVEKRSLPDGLLPTVEDAEYSGVNLPDGAEALEDMDSVDPDELLGDDIPDDDGLPDEDDGQTEV